MQQKTKQQYVVSHETKLQTKPPRHAAKQKQVKLHKPCIYDKQLGFNKPAVVIADSLFADFRYLCLTVFVRYATSVQGRVSEQTHRKSSALVHKQALIKNYCFYDQQRKIIRPQTTRINIICILHPFYVQNHNKRSYALIIRT